VGSPSLSNADQASRRCEASERSVMKEVAESAKMFIVIGPSEV
jgi:hypothetical protein